MGHFKITAVSDTKRPWGDGMIEYRVHLRESDGTPEGKLHERVEWSRKSTAAAPIVGQELDGELQEAKYGQKFKQARQPGGYGGGRGGPEDPKKAAAIQRMHSQEHALAITRACFDYGIEPKPAGKQEFFDLLKKAIDFLDNDVNEARKNAPTA